MFQTDSDRRRIWWEHNRLRPKTSGRYQKPFNEFGESACNHGVLTKTHHYTTQ